ncbi:MAG: transposase, partial [Caldisphaeraceae archaeon]|nr:transposase [Caldisphaeraceae archaeon]
ALKLTLRIGGLYFPWFATITWLSTYWMPLGGNSLKCSYKAESAGKRVIKVNPRGTSGGLTINDP